MQQQQQMQQRQKDQQQQQMGNNNNNTNNANSNANANTSNNSNNNGNAIGGQQQQQMFRNRAGEVPNVLGQINQIFTPDEQRALLQEAMEACKTFQKTQFGANMTDANRQSFIRKYINQKALKKIQSSRMAQQAAAAAAASASGARPGQNNMNMNGNNEIANTGGNNNNNNNNMAVGNNNNVPSRGNMQQMNNLQNVPQQARNTPISQQQMQAQQQAQAQQPQQQAPPSQGHQRTNSQKASMLQLLQPTPQDIDTVRKISTDAARTPLRLNDLTNSISPQEREEIKRKLQMNQQLFAQVSNYAPQVYVFTKSEAFLKEVLQLRIFVKEILDKCSKGIYVVKLDTVDKLIMKYQKYWESMKIQILRRQQLIQQQQQLIRQKQQQQQDQQPPTGNNTPINSIPTPVQNNANMTQAQAQDQRMRPNQRTQLQNRQLQQQQQQQMQWQQQQQLNNSNANTPQMNNNFVQMNGAMPNANAMNVKLNGRQPSVSIPPNAVISGENDSMISQANGNQFITANGTPDIMKGNSRNASVPTSTKVSPSREKTATSNGATGKGNNSKKPSPSTSTSSRNVKSLSNVPTPRLANVSARVTPQLVGNDQLSASSGEINPVFKKEEDELQSLNVKKTEIASRFKHRQEVFQSSPIDLFLSTLSDTLGLKDDEYEPQIKFSQDFIDITNRTGKKKKLTKVAQRARERDPVNVSIVDGNKLVMKSKYMSEQKEVRNYGINLGSISSIFNGLENNICEKLNDLAFINTPSNIANCNTKKRKLDEMNLTPDSIKSNANDSPSIMSESKRIKFDSPEDTYVAAEGKMKKDAAGINFASTITSGPATTTMTNDTSDDKKDINIWDWDYWANKI